MFALFQKASKTFVGHMTWRGVRDATNCNVEEELQRLARDNMRNAMKSFMLVFRWKI